MFVPTNQILGSCSWVYVLEDGVLFPVNQGFFLFFFFESGFLLLLVLGEHSRAMMFSRSELPYRWCVASALTHLLWLLDDCSPANELISDRILTIVIN